jgi:hypothetical protein
MEKEIWIRASGPPAKLEFPGGEKFLLTGEPQKFSGDLAPFARRALQRCHGIEECSPPAPPAAPPSSPPGFREGARRAPKMTATPATSPEKE